MLTQYGSVWVVIPLYLLATSGCALLRMAANESAKKSV